MRLEMRCAIWNFWNFSTFSKPSWELLIWNFQIRLETRYAIWNEMCYLKLLKLETFQPIIGVGYLKLSDKTGNEMCYLKLLKPETFQPIIGVSYLKLSDKTWNEMCYLKFLKLFQPFQTHHKSCLFETFRWDLKQDILFDIFETWNFSNPSWGGGVAYLKLSDETCNEMCYLKAFKAFQTFEPITGVGYLKLSDETWNEMCYLKLLKLFNPSQELVIWNFQIRLEMRGVIWNFWNFETFSNSWWGLLIWNFQMRLEMRCAIRTF